uniref:BTB domain-containing protein n=1 Tax=Rhabditophanes sp. KR3021 TaxID=114890 RepID=A0AC35TI18_9BILA
MDASDVLATSTKDGNSTLYPITFHDGPLTPALERLKYLRFNGNFCDVSIKCKNKEFSAHRVILAATSPYFNSVLKTDKITKERIFINCQYPDIFEPLLMYFYTGSITINRQSVIETMRLANNFLMIRLKQHCANYLEQCMDPSNCITVKKIATKYNIPTLLTSSCDFFDTNYTKCLLESVDIPNFKFYDLHKILTDPKYTVMLTPEVHLKVITRWVNHCIEERESEFPQLVKDVNLPTINSNTLGYLLDYSRLFEVSPFCRYHLLNLIYKYQLPLHKYAMQLDNLFKQITAQGIDCLRIGSKNATIVINTNEGLPPVSDVAALIQTDAGGMATVPGAELRPSLRVKISMANRNTEKLNSDNSKGRKRGRPNKESKVPLKLPVVESEPDSVYYEFDENLEEVVLFDPEEEDDPEMMLKEPTVESCPAEKATHQCEDCNFQSENKKALHIHIAKIHSKNILFVCALCQYECTWHKQFYSHMRAHFPGQTHKCDLCDYSSDSIHMLLSHRTCHSDEKPFKCSFCSHRFRVKSNLYTHIRLHTGEKPFSCEHCDKSFATRRYLTLHLATHVDERFYQCDECEFSTKYQSHLISHKRIHTGDLFHCEHADCTYSSPKKSQLAAHLRTHLAVRSHRCSVCNRSFIEKSHLVRHERIHLTEKPFKCDNCSYASSRRDKLKEHIQKHHSTDGTINSNKLTRRKVRREKQLEVAKQQTQREAETRQLRTTDPNRIFRPINMEDDGESLISADGLSNDNNLNVMHDPNMNLHNNAVDFSGMHAGIMNNNRSSSAVIQSTFDINRHPLLSPSRSLNLGNLMDDNDMGESSKINQHYLDMSTMLSHDNTHSMIDASSNLLHSAPMRRSPKSTNFIMDEMINMNHNGIMESQRPTSLPPFSHSNEMWIPQTNNRLSPNLHQSANLNHQSNEQGQIVEEGKGEEEDYRRHDNMMSFANPNVDLGNTNNNEIIRCNLDGGEVTVTFDDFLPKNRKHEIDTVPTQSSYILLVQVLFPFLIAGLGMVLAGTLLDVVQHWPLFKKIPEIFILVPALLGLKGNLEMTLASRLSTLANTGRMENKDERFKILMANIALIQTQAIVVAFLASSFAILLAWVPKGSIDWSHACLLCASSLTTASLASAVLSVIMIGVVLLAKRFNIDPDNVATPIAASLGDLITLSILACFGSYYLRAHETESWLNIIVIFLFILISPFCALAAYRDQTTATVLCEGWTPIVFSMLISSAGGFVLETAIRKFPQIALFQPVINGVGGNLGAVHASKITTSYHKSSVLGLLPANWSIRRFFSFKRAFFSNDWDSKAARVLLFLVIPGHIFFNWLIQLLQVGSSETPNSPLFTSFYLLAALFQVILILYICQLLVAFLWQKQIDPDNAAIPYLTAIGDLTGTVFLYFAFKCLVFMNDRDIIEKS